MFDVVIMCTAPNTLKSGGFPDRVFNQDQKANNNYMTTISSMLTNGNCPLNATQEMLVEGEWVDASILFFFNLASTSSIYGYVNIVVLFPMPMTTFRFKF